MTIAHLRPDTLALIVRDLRDAQDDEHWTEDDMQRLRDAEEEFQSLQGDDLGVTSLDAESYVYPKK